MTTIIKKIIVEGFPYPTISKIIGLPTYKTISDTHEMLNTNSSSIQSNLGGGSHGNLSLTVTNAVFNTLLSSLLTPVQNWLVFILGIWVGNW